MAKQSGLGDALLLDGYNISGDINALGEIGGGPNPLDMQGIDTSGNERRGGLLSGRMEMTALFNDGVGAAHVAFSTLPTTDRCLTYLRGQGLGSPAACLVGKQLGYDPNRGPDGMLTETVRGESNGYGLEWGVQATPGVRSDTGATNGSSIDFGTGSTLFGLQAYLQLTAFTGTSVTVKLQGSSDNGAGDAWADITDGGFAAATAIGWQRIQTGRTQTIERYLRVVTTGTFSAASFVVVVVRNDTAVTF